MTASDPLQAPAAKHQVLLLYYLQLSMFQAEQNDLKRGGSAEPHDRHSLLLYLCVSTPIWDKVRQAHQQHSPPYSRGQWCPRRGPHPAGLQGRSESCGCVHRAAAQELGPGPLIFGIRTANPPPAQP